MVHVMKLKNEPFQKIKSGQKTVELRLFDNKRRQLDIGDDIIFTNLSNADERLAVRVKALYRYASFEELFNEISPEKCGNRKGETAKEAAVGMLKYYSDNQIRSYGVLGIKIELVPLEESMKWLEAIQEATYDRLFPDGMK